MQLHLGRWRLAVTHRTPTPRLDALRDDEVITWATDCLRDQQHRPTRTRHHVHRYTSPQGTTKLLKFDDHPEGAYGGYVHIERDPSDTEQGLRVDVSACPTCATATPLRLSS